MAIIMFAEGYARENCAEREVNGWGTRTGSQGRGDTCMNVGLWAKQRG